MLAAVPRLVWVLLSIVGRTWRFEVIAEEGAEPRIFGQGAGPEIYCFWHQCVLPCAVYYRTTGATILISRSFDGELITRTLRLFGFDAVRGSSSRGAREGLLGLKDVIESGRPAIFTADGPRGPIYETKMGPIKLAQMTGVPIGAFHLQPQRAWVMNSWDKFLVPKPFTRIVVTWAQWTRVPEVTRCTGIASTNSFERNTPLTGSSSARAATHWILPANRCSRRIRCSACFAVIGSATT